MRRGGPPASLRARLGRTYRLLVVLLVLVGGVGAAGMGVTQHESADHFSHAEPLFDSNSAVLQAMTDAETGVRGYQLTGEQSFLQPYRRAIAALPRQLAEAERLTGGNRHARRLVDGERHAARSWLDGFAEQVIAGRSVPPLSGKALFDRFRAANARVGAYADHRLSIEQQNAALAVRVAVAVFIAVLLVAVALSIRGARQSIRSLLAPLESLQHTVHALARGDLSARAEQSGPAEIRVVAESVNRLAAETETLQTIDAERVRRDNAVRTVERAMRTELDPQAVLARAVAVLGEVLGVERVVIRASEDGTRHPIAAEWTREAGTAITRAQFREVPLALVSRMQPYIDKQRAVAVDDMERSGWTAREEGRAYVQSMRIRAAVICPLVESGQLIGYLSLHELSGPREWSATDIAVTELAAREIAIALGHARLYAQQVRMVDRLTSLDRERDVFVSTVSHELRTPLTSIAGYIELLTDGDAGELTAPQRSMLEVIDRNTSRLRQLIEDLLTLSRIESGAFAVARVALDLEPVLAEACEAMRPAADAGRILLVCDQQAPGALLAGDAVQLERVALNLISNAVKFTPAGGTVRVRTAVEHGDLVLTVSDTGIGIPAEEQPKLFQRFFRASTATDRAIPGTGLGLTVVASIVAAHGGRVDVASDTGVGTTVVVRLPLLAEGAATPSG